MSGRVVLGHVSSSAVCCQASMIQSGRRRMRQSGPKRRRGGLNDQQVNFSSPIDSLVCAVFPSAGGVWRYDPTQNENAVKGWKADSGR